VAQTDDLLVTTIETINAACLAHGLPPLKAEEARHSLEQALDWLADGAILVRLDGTVCYANEAMQAIARRGDGIAITKGRVEFAAAEARAHFATALMGIGRLRERPTGSATIADFSVGPSSDAPPYLVAIRPIPVEHRTRGAKMEAEAIVFVRDPLSRNTTALRMLRDVLKLTDAEASVAQSLQAGMRLEDYARARGVSIHTVYAHLRSIKEKTGCSRMGELIAKLNALQVPLRLD
jgi:DNA-binding CsgD family transcriptional regulator